MSDECKVLGDGMTDGQRLDWLLENGYAIVPERGAGSFAEEVFSTREELDAFMSQQQEGSRQGAKDAEALVVGDYVLATKFGDGDPQDHWAIGFYAGVTAPHYDPPRFDVVDNEGRQFRGNGFRRVEKITRERGEWMLKHARLIELSSKSVWYFATCPMD